MSPNQLNGYQNMVISRHFLQSGRQDLNLRPPGPQLHGPGAAGFVWVALRCSELRSVVLSFAQFGPRIGPRMSTTPCAHAGRPGPSPGRSGGLGRPACRNPAKALALTCAAAATAARLYEGGSIVKCGWGVGQGPLWVRGWRAALISLSPPRWEDQAEIGGRLRGRNSKRAVKRPDEEGRLPERERRTHCG